MIKLCFHSIFSTHLLMSPLRITSIFYAFCTFTFFRYCRFYWRQRKNELQKVGHLFSNLSNTFGPWIGFFLVQPSFAWTKSTVLMSLVTKNCLSEGIPSLNPKGGGGGSKCPIGQEIGSHFSQNHAMVTKILDFIHKHPNQKVVR